MEPTREQAPRRLDAVVLAVALALAHALRFSGCSVDDAYISFRYAWHLAHGDGLVFNPGQRVEGYTNFLWTLLAALTLRLGAPAPMVVPLVGLAALLALVAFTGRAARALRAPDAPARPSDGALAAGVVALSAGLAYHAFAGLETVAFTLAFTVAAVAAVRGRPVAFGLAAAAAILLRPEGGLVAAFGLAALAPAGGLVVARAAAIVGAVVVPYLGWKLDYFHALLPNTLLAKVPDRAAGLRYLLAWLSFAGPLLAACVAAARRLRREGRWLLGLVLAHLAAVVIEGGDWMLGARLCLPSLPCLAIVFESVARPHLAPGRGALAWRMALAAALALWLGQNLLDGARIRHTNEIQEPQDAANAALARELLARGARSTALFDIGVFGYAAPAMRIDDLGALTDAALARYPGGLGRKRVDDAWLDRRSPDLVLVNAFPIGALGDPAPRLRVQWPVERRLLALPSFRARYVEACTASVAGYHLALVFRRRDLALGPPPAAAHCTTREEALRHAGRWSEALAAAFSPE